jgi:DNA polymerase-3 subunit delta
MATQITKKFESLMDDIAGKKFANIYMFDGEEPYFIDLLTAAIERHALTPEERSFNLITVYGLEVVPLDVIMAAKRYPMSADRQLIIIKEAQNIRSFDAFESYFENPSSTTIMVFGYKGKKFDKRLKVAKLLNKHVHFTSERLREDDLPEWIDGLIRSKGKRIDPLTSNLIAEFLGSDLSKITNEVNKMLENLGSEILDVELKHVEEYIGVSKDYNVFELQKAVGSREFNKAIQIVNYFASDIRSHPIIPVIALLNSFFTRLYVYHNLRSKQNKEVAMALGINPFFVKDYSRASANYSSSQIEEILGYLKYYDLRAKGVDDTGNHDAQLLIEMVVRILRIGEMQKI